VAPVLVGTGAGIELGGFSWLRGGLALLVSLALQVGVNYANDYSDGIRGTDADRVGPTRLVGAGLATPSTVKLAAFGCFGVAGLAGLILAALTSWWLIPVGIAAVAAAWFYTGGPKPYGYAGFGEIFVFVFFGLVAVLGTTYVQAGEISLTATIAAVGIGLLACALLMANNLRDVHTDVAAGKRTLAVLLGEPLSRKVFALMVSGAFLAVVVISVSHPWCLLALLAGPLAVPPVRQVLTGARGPALVVVLGATARVEIVYAALLAIGLALGA
jgi:1,4-dihydroxy-2-naphthoate octaprenyltransferase